MEVTKNYVLRQILDEVILVPVSPEARQKNRLLVLNPSAAFFYQNLRDGKAQAEIQRLAAEEFSVDSSTLESDFAEFLKEMEELGAIRAKSQD